MEIIHMLSVTMLISSVVIAAADQRKTTHENSLLSQCTVYLAPSTIEGAGLGIFTSIPRAEGTVVGVSDVIVPIIDLQQHHSKLDFFWVLTEYVWDGRGMMGMHSESVHEPLDAYAPGLDCAINCHLGLLNVERTFPSYDTNLPHRSKHPSAGSMSAYWNSTTYTTTTVPAGAELFKYYGESWFESRASVFPNVPLLRHYKEAAVLLQDIVTKWTGWALTDAAQNDLYRMIVSMQSPLLNALPARWDQIDQALHHGIRSALQPNHVREAIQDMPNARCMESIVPGQSQIEGAGRGGFAAWNFRKDQVITGSPLIHIPDKVSLEMYEYKENEESSAGLDSPPPGGEFVVHGHQLLLNYCYGHPETTLILCPYGSGVNYINHAPRHGGTGGSSGGEPQANVKIQWAPSGHMGQDNSWWDKSVVQLKGSRQAQLAWDFVALRDIDQGEELLLDYGDEWVSAWENHVGKWHAKLLENDQTKMNATTATTDNNSNNDDASSEWYDADYKSAAEWNELYGENDIRTEREQDENPYPEHIDIVCHKNVKDNTHHLRQTRWSAHEIWNIAMDGVPCVVKDRLRSVDGETYYTVEMEVGDDQGTNHVRKRSSDGTTARFQRLNVHRNMFRFRDVHYSTDMHLEGVFRKEATIPDDLLPKAWRNKPAHQGSSGRHDEL
jgi:hypothetical protein